MTTVKPLLSPRAGSLVRKTLWQRMRYRVAQFAASLWPRVPQEERRLLVAWLPPQAVDLFLCMPLRDQRHSLNVFHTLRAAGYEHPDLLAAALLHDIGKTVGNGRRLRLWHRVIIVLLEALAPGWLARLSTAGQHRDNWLHPFYIHVNHPELGAALARNAGCSELTTDLIQRHQARLPRPASSETEHLLAALQAADDSN